MSRISDLLKVCIEIVHLSSASSKWSPPSLIIQDSPSMTVLPGHGRLLSSQIAQDIAANYLTMTSGLCHKVTSRFSICFHLCLVVSMWPISWGKISISILHQPSNGYLQDCFEIPKLGAFSFPHSVCSKHWFAGQWLAWSALPWGWGIDNIRIIHQQTRWEDFRKKEKNNNSSSHCPFLNRGFE